MKLLKFFPVTTLIAILSLVAQASVRADAIDLSIAQLDAAIKLNVRNYTANYPAGNNDPNPVRRQFLGVDPSDQPGSSFDYSSELRGLVDQTLDLRQQNLTDSQLDQISKTISLGLETSLQGWLICGNISLLEGLRVSYPTGGSQGRPGNLTIPYGCPENQFSFVPVKDAYRAGCFYQEGVRTLANVLSRHAGNSLGQVIIDVDTDPIPSPINSYPRAFANEQFPQYTYYVDLVPGISTKVVPIQTEASMLGQLLQASQTVGYRLWTAAYFNSATQRDPAKRQQLLDTAVHELHAGANLQFLTSVALAANVGDQAVTTSESPFDLTQLRNARANVAEARSTIDRIRHNEKPTLPIDEIMAGDQQVNNLIATIKGSGAGSITKAQSSYSAAQATLFKVQNNAVQAFQEEQTRQNGFYDKLAALTGISVDQTTISTTAGQAAYRQQVADAINSLMNNPNPDFSLGASELVQAIKQVRYQRQEVLNKKDIIESYPAKIKIIEDTLGANVSAIKSSEGSITASQIAIGYANSVSITASASATYTFAANPLNSGLSISAGISVTYNPGAIKVANLQNDITRASNLKEMQFLQNNAAEQCRNLLLEQNQALGSLKSQVILLQNAEDDVNRVLGSANRILAQLNNYNQLTAQLFYNDPTFNQEMTAEEEQANVDLNALVGNLYKLGRLLEQRWLEPFCNPVSVFDGQPIALPDPNFDRFWALESVFSLGSVNVRDVANASPPHTQASNFYSALEAWDTLLRSGIRAFDGDLGTPVEISLRQDVFSYADVKTVNGSIVALDYNPITNPNYLTDISIHDNNVRRFKNLLLNHGLYFYTQSNQQMGDKYRGFLLPFHLSYYDVGFTGGRRGIGNLFGQINAWNFRIDKFKVKVIPSSGKSVFTGLASTPIIFAQSGLVSDIDFFEHALSGRTNTQRRVREINLDNYVRYNLSDLNLSSGSSYLLFSIAKQNNYPTDTEIPTSSAMLPRFWSPFCSNWLLEFVPIPDFEIENIDDIVIQMDIKTGVPLPPKWL